MQNSFFKQLIKFIFTIILIIVGIYVFLQKMNATDQNQSKTQQILQKLWKPKKDVPEQLQQVFHKNNIIQENTVSLSTAEKTKEENKAPKIRTLSNQSQNTNENLHPEATLANLQQEHNELQIRTLSNQSQNTKENLYNESILKSLQEENKELKIQMQNLQLQNTKENSHNEFILKSLQEENKELKIQIQNLQKEFNEIKQNQTIFMNEKDIEHKQTQNYINNLTNYYNQLQTQLLTLQTFIEQNKVISLPEQNQASNTEVNEPIHPTVTPVQKTNENLVLQSLIVLDDNMNNIHIHGQLNLPNSAHIWCLKNCTQEKIQLEYNLEHIYVATSNSLKSTFHPIQTPILESTQTYLKIYSKNRVDSISNTYDLYLKASSTELDEIIIQSFEEN